MALANVSLDDKFDLSKGRIFSTGYQALVRLCLMQKELDRRAGLNTAGYVSGYRGSPLGGLDQQFVRAKRWLDKADVLFQPGLNEDLAATALWGTQQAELRGEGKYDGVFGMWYGKGPGVDRCGDVFRHANFAGTSKHGGVLALMGDDHTAESSTTAHQSEYHFVDVMIPILNPGGVQEFLDYGLYGWAMSRYCGTWVALKCMHETVESTAVVDDSAVWSSPMSARTPPYLDVPAKLAWRNASPERSTPGDFPYQTPIVPSYAARRPGSGSCEPQTAVAASSSFTPGTSAKSGRSRSSGSDASARSRPPSGLPG